MHIKNSLVCEAKALLPYIKFKTNVNAELQCSTLKTDSLKCQANKTNQT